MKEQSSAPEIAQEAEQGNEEAVNVELQMSPVTPRDSEQGPTLADPAGKCYCCTVRSPDFGMHAHSFHESVDEEDSAFVQQMLLALIYSEISRHIIMI